MEIVSCNQRVSTNVILNLFYPVGDVLLGVVAMYVTDWRWFLRILYGPGVIFFLYYW